MRDPRTVPNDAKKIWNIIYTLPLEPLRTLTSDAQKFWNIIYTLPLEGNTNTYKRIYKNNKYKKNAANMII